MNDECRLMRRHVLHALAASGLASAVAGWARLAHAADAMTFPFENGLRELTSAFPQKGEMVLVRSRPPLLETPFSVFDDGVFTPNDRFFVRWHLSGLPTRIDTRAFRLAIGGHVARPLALSLDEIADLRRERVI